MSSKLNQKRNSKRRKLLERYNVTSSSDDDDNSDEVDKAEPVVENGWISMVQIISQAKKKLQDAEKKNGVTFAFIGSSGCGKSTLIRKIFIDEIFTKVAKEEDKKDFIIVVFTESPKSDAFKDMDKTVVVDGKGLDENTINWCFNMNEKYEKKYNFLIILDDCIDIQFKKLVRRMFLIMRNTNISSLVSIQYPNLIPKSVRTSVYFTVIFYFNSNEGVELVVRGWLSAYIPGKNIQEKMMYFRKWTKEEDGHRMFLVDNLNHKCYLVKGDYTCRELPMIESVESFSNKSSSKIIHENDVINDDIIDEEDSE